MSLGAIEHLVQFFFHFLERHHFAADFGEALLAASDRDEAVVIKRGQIAGDVPAIDDFLTGQVLLAEITLHHIRAINEQQAFLTGRQRFQRVLMNNADGDAGYRLADGARLIADLTAASFLPVGNIDGRHRR